MGKQIYLFQKHYVITWPYTNRTNDRPSAPQENQCLLSHFLGTVWEPKRKKTVSLIIPQYESSKIRVFVKNTILKFEDAREGEDGPTWTTNKLYTSELTVIWNHPWPIITCVTKEHISQVSWVKSRIAPFLQNRPVLYHTTLLWVHSTVYVGRESRFQ